MYFKYPRTFHLPFSEGVSDDDKVIPSIEQFLNKEVVCLEKCDGENTNFYSDHIHARSIDSKHHPSRNWIKTLHAKIKHEIPKDFRICGENLFAKHSIYYKNLETYFYVFAIYDENNICLSWDDTVSYANILNLITMPVLYRGIWNEQKIKECWTGKSTISPGDLQEGYVVRLADSFHYNEHIKSTAKFVHKGFQAGIPDIHWATAPVIPNLLRSKND